jgi:hypothetical protein
MLNFVNFARDKCFSARRKRMTSTSLHNPGSIPCREDFYRKRKKHHNSPRPRMNFLVWRFGIEISVLNTTNKRGLRRYKLI